MVNDRKITKFIFEYFYRKYFHIGWKRLIHFVSMQFQPVSGKNIVRKLMFNCFVYFSNNLFTVKKSQVNSHRKVLPSGKSNSNIYLNITGAIFWDPFGIKYPDLKKGISRKVENKLDRAKKKNIKKKYFSTKQY